MLEREVFPSGVVRLVLHSPEIARTALPGQFVMVSSGGHFLRRPYSIAGVERDSVVLLVKIVGDGSSAIASVGVGMELSIFGPLGRGFPVDEVKSALLIAGGIGIAPMLFAASELAGEEIPYLMLYGERTASLFLPDRYIPPDARLATDDGSAAFSGSVIDMLDELDIAVYDAVFACGPEGMLVSLKRALAHCERKLYISLEERMACGIGACYGCAVPSVSGGYLRVCTDGPVFDAEEVALV